MMGGWWALNDAKKYGLRGIPGVRTTLQPGVFET
jgi:hypothetical protein